MTTRVSYLNSEKTFWQDIDLKNIERDFFTDGIADFTKTAPSPSLVGEDLQVINQDTPDKTIKIKKGVAYFQVTRETDTDGDGQSDTLVLRFQSFADVDLGIPDNDSGGNKTFEICCSIPSANLDAEQINETASNVGELIVQEEGTGLENKYLLATITVENNFTEITSEKITDKRGRVQFKAIPKGLTASISEINLALDGILASAEDLNILENTTVGKDEFNNALTGIEVSAAELNLLHEVAGLSKSDLQKLANINASKDEINQALDGISQNVSAANLNILMGGGFTNLHKHSADPTLSGITESPICFYLPTGEIEAVAEKGIMTRFIYEEETVNEGTQNIEVLNDDFENYENFYQTITNFENETGETYTGGSFDTTEFKQGTQGRKRTLSVDSTGTLLINFSAKDLSRFAGSDTIEFWVFVTMQTNVDMATIQLGSTTPSSNYFQNNFLSQIIENGWNKISIPISSFSQNGSANWSNIIRVRLEFSTNTNGTCDFTVDSLRAIKSANTTNSFWEENEGEWEIHEISDSKRYTQTDEKTADHDNVLSLGTQSRSYKDGIITVRTQRLQGNGKVGVKFRYANASSFYLVYTTPTSLVFAKNTGAENPTQQVAESFANNTDYWLRVEFKDSSIKISISTDGVNFQEKINATDSSISDAGQIALFSNECIVAFDNVIFEQTSNTSERDIGEKVVKIEENTGYGDTFDDQDTFFKQYETIGGTWGIEENTDENYRYLLQNDESASEKFLLLKTDGVNNKFTNFTWRGKFQTGENNTGTLICKYQNTDNFLRLQYKNGKISFIRRLAGSDTVFGEEVSFSPQAGNFYHLKIECDNNVFKYFYSEDDSVWVLIDEVSIADFTDGQIGIYCENAILRVDQIYCFEHNDGGDTFYEIFYDADGKVSSIIKKPIY